MTAKDETKKLYHPARKRTITVSASQVDGYQSAGWLDEERRKALAPTPAPRQDAQS